MQQKINTNFCYKLLLFIVINNEMKLQTNNNQHV